MARDKQGTALPASGGQHELLDVTLAYAEVVRRSQPRDVEEAALRNRSLAIREAVARAASDGTYGYSDLVTDQAIAALDPVWASSLGRIVGLQDLLPEDRDLASRLLDAHARQLPQRRRLAYQVLLAELLYASERFDDVRRLLDEDDALATHAEGYLWTDLRNPYTASPYADPGLWRAGFARWFEQADLELPEVGPSAGRPFDGLTCNASDRVDGDLVTVVMTTFRPERAPLLTSIRSVLAQTWRNLEVIVVDDCSGDSFSPVLDELAQLDPRVTVIRLDRNGGTYIARNVALAAATGTYVTGQDDDDWSHPRRIELQVAALRAEPSAPASVSRCLAVREDLVMQRPGYRPLRQNASSLMARRELLLKTDGFLASRKGADSELHQRLMRMAGHPSVMVRKPLAIVRIRQESLSRGDFRPGWHHPSRRAFRSSYERWHETNARRRLRASEAPVFAIPDRFMIDEPPHRVLDAVVVADFRVTSPSLPRGVACDRVLALAEAGLRVGVLHMDSWRIPSAKAETIDPLLQDRINAGTVRRVLSDDAVTAGVVVVADPSVLQFASPERVRLRTSTVALLAEETRQRDHPPRLLYDAAAVTAAAHRIFGTQVTWLASGTLDSRPGEAVLHPLVRPATFRDERRRRRGEQPVLGVDLTALASWMPMEHLLGRISGRADLRVLDLRPVGDSGDESTSPGPLLRYTESDISRRAFLGSVDLLLVPGPRSPESERLVLEGLASGCVVLTTHRVRRAVEPAVVRVHSPEDLAREVRQYGNDTVAFVERSARSVAMASRSAGTDRWAETVRSLSRQTATDGVS